MQFSRWIFLCLLIPILWVSDHSIAHANAQNKLLILGDSLSAAYGLKQDEGWVSLLQDAFVEKNIQVVNAAISGETTDGGLARLPRLLEQHEPTHLLIELGGNDGLQGHPINKIRSNITTMIEMAQQRDITVYLQQMRIPTNYGRRYTSMFTDSYSELAEQHDIPLIPFFMDDIALDKSLMLPDGIHPALEAQPLIAEFMQNQLEPLILN
ncbi:arylesterase [Aestuariibacter salexigens]|uniref:arylesterase n=1 Tax=Aestuariibacter salexigens TaxID=226010 RepID=UPI00047AAB5B|nr:arylesterase [Aestuariibacter salexigens]